MDHVLHLLMLAGNRQRALGQPIAGRWLLPVLRCAERERAPLAAARWMASRGIGGHVVGQWLGHVARDARTMDWLIAIQLAPDCTTAPAPFGWLPVEHLDGGCALLAYQAGAIRELTSSGALAVSGPFGTLDWPDRVHTWACAAAGIRFTSVRCFRASPHEVVLGLAGDGTRMYFKGLAGTQASDAGAMQTAARLLPHSFPRTIACETQSDGATWWLMDECSGTDLTGCHADTLAAVARDVARLQEAITGNRDALFAIPRLDLGPVHLEADRILRMAGQRGMPRELASAFDPVSALSYGWTPLDLDPVNVFVHGADVRYIDLDARVAPTPLAMSIFIRRVLARCEANTRRDLVRTMRLAYESASPVPVPWESVDRVAHVVEIVQGWRRLMRNVACGEVSGPVDVMASIVARRLRDQSMR